MKFLLSTLLLIFSANAFSDQPDNRPPENRPATPSYFPGINNEQTTTAISGARAGAKAGAVAVGGNGTGGSSVSKSEGGDAVSSNDGNSFDAGDTTSSTSNKNSNFYVSRSLPPSFNSCALSADAGGGNEGKAGFLGIQWMDHGCVMDKLAELEDNADLKSRLKCGNKRYRKAVAFDQPRKERHDFCVTYTKAIYVAEIDIQRKALEETRQHAIDIISAELANSGN